MQRWAENIVESSFFQNFIIVVILSAGVLVGLETYPEISEKYHKALAIGDKLILIIFILEIVLKMMALAPKPLAFFKDPWNCFDFLIVAVCLIPGLPGFGPVLRLIRLLRVLRLLAVVPKLQLLVSALLRSLPSMFYVTILLGLLFYIYAVAGVILFGKNDPIHFGDIGIALLSLFRIVTLEDWTDVMYLQYYGSAHYEGYNVTADIIGKHEYESKAMPLVAVIYFVSFVLVGTMVMLNLVIGVIINGMDDARVDAEIEKIKDAERALGGGESLKVENQITMLTKQIKELEGAVSRLGKTVSDSAQTKN